MLGKKWQYEERRREESKRERGEKERGEKERGEVRGKEEEKRGEKSRCEERGDADVRLYIVEEKQSGEGQSEKLCQLYSQHDCVLSGFLLVSLTPFSGCHRDT